MPLIKKRFLVLFKIESTPGTDPTPTAGSNACMVEKLEIKQVTDPGERSGASGSGMDPSRVQGGCFLEATFEMELKGSGTAGTPPAETALLQVCGFKVTNTPATSDSYSLDITDGKTGTGYFYRDGKLFEANYCMGSVVISKEGRRPPRGKFRIIGLWVPAVDSSLPAPTLPSTKPVALGQTLTFGGVTPKVKSWEIDPGTDVQMLTDDLATYGYWRAKIVGFAPMFKLQVEEELVATRDDHANALINTGLAWDGTIGTTAGNKIDVNMAKCHINEIGPGEAEGVSVLDISGQARGSTDAATDAVVLLYY